MRRCVAFAGILLAQSACAQPVFECSTHASCGRDGRCEPGGACSFPDDACPSGRRFGEFAGSVAGMCVAEESIGTTDLSGTSEADTTSSSMSTSEPMPDADSTHAVVDTTSSSEPATSDEATASTDATSTGGPIELDPIPIADDFDDGAMYGGAMATTWLPSGERGLGGFFGEFPLGEPYFGYFRFTLPQPIAADTVVHTAVLELHGWTTHAWNSEVDALLVFVELSADAEQVDAADDFPPSGETVLGEHPIRWPEDGGLLWNVDAANTSPDLSPLLQTLVDTYGGLPSGSHVQFWIRKAELGMTESEVGYVDAFVDPEQAATLTIELQ